MGHNVPHNAVKEALKGCGVDYAPERSRRTTWAQLMKTRWDSLAATDFFTSEVWAARGLVTFYTLFLIELRTRRVQMVGSTPHLNEVFLRQAALDLVAFDDSFLSSAIHLIMDRDTKLIFEFKSSLIEHGVKQC